MSFKAPVCTLKISITKRLGSGAEYQPNYCSAKPYKKTEFIQFFTKFVLGAEENS